MKTSCPSFIPWPTSADDKLFSSGGAGCRQEEVDRGSDWQDSPLRPVLSGSNRGLYGVASPFFYVRQPFLFLLALESEVLLRMTSHRVLVGRMSNPDTPEPLHTFQEGFLVGHCTPWIFVLRSIYKVWSNLHNIKVVWKGQVAYVHPTDRQKDVVIIKDVTYYVSQGKCWKKSLHLLLSCLTLLSSGGSWIQLQWF